MEPLHIQVVMGRTSYLRLFQRTICTLCHIGLKPSPPLRIVIGDKAHTNAHYILITGNNTTYNFIKRVRLVYLLFDLPH